MHLSVPIALLPSSEKSALGKNFGGKGGQFFPSGCVSLCAESRPCLVEPILPGLALRPEIPAWT